MEKVDYIAKRTKRASGLGGSLADCNVLSGFGRQDLRGSAPDWRDTGLF